MHQAYNILGLRVCTSRRVNIDGSKIKTYTRERNGTAVTITTIAPPVRAQVPIQGGILLEEVIGVYEAAVVDVNES